MFSKQNTVLAVILFAVVQCGDAGVVGDPKLEERIEDMWEKVNDVKVNFLDDLVNEIQNETDIEEGVRDKLVAVFIEISNGTQDHYADVEQEARRSGSLNYTSPVMYVVRGFVEHKGELSDALKDLVRDTENMNEETKRKFMDFIDGFVDWGMGCFDGVLEIQRTNPHEFDVLEDAADWDDFEDPIPSHYSPEVQATGRKIRKVYTRCKTQFAGFETQLKKLITDWVSSAIADALDRLNELDKED